MAWINEFLFLRLKMQDYFQKPNKNKKSLAVQLKMIKY
jgi:hypothetical protein